MVPEKKPGLFMTWNEYAVSIARKDKKFSFTLGAGLHYMGLSRLTMASTLNF
jgi:hypothetical protein